MQPINLQRKEYEMVTYSSVNTFYRTITDLSLEGYVVHSFCQNGDYPIALMERDVLHISLREELQNRYSQYVSASAKEVHYDPASREIVLRLCSGAKFCVLTGDVKWVEKLGDQLIGHTLADLSYAELKSVCLLSPQTISFPGKDIRLSIEELVINFLGEAYLG